MLSLSDLIIAGLLQFVWILFIQGPLALLSAASVALQFVAGGLQWVIFFNAPIKVENGTIIPPDWSSIQIPWPFIGMLIIAFVIGLVIFIIRFIKIYSTNGFDQQPLGVKIGQALKLAAMSILITLAIPVFYFLLTIMLSFFISAITRIFTQGSMNIADYIYVAGWVGDPQFVPTPPADYGPPASADILQYNFLVQLVGTWMSLFCVLMMCFMIVVKTVELFFLFLIGPVLACLMMQDDGKKMNIWKDMTIAKNCVIIANYLGYWLFVYLIQISFNVMNSIPVEGMGGASQSVIKGFLLLVFLCGATLGIWGLGPLTAAFFGDAAGMRESMSQFRALIPMRMISKAAKMGLMTPAKMVKGGLAGGAANGARGAIGGVFGGLFQINTNGMLSTMNRDRRQIQDNRNQDKQRINAVNGLKDLDATEKQKQFENWSKGADLDSLKRIQDLASSKNGLTKKRNNAIDAAKNLMDEFNSFKKSDSKTNVSTV